MEICCVAKQNRDGEGERDREGRLEERVTYFFLLFSTCQRHNWLFVFSHTHTHTHTYTTTITFSLLESICGTRLTRVLEGPADGVRESSRP